MSLVLHSGLHGVDAAKHPLAADTAGKAVALARWFADQQLGLLARGRRKAEEKLEEDVFRLIESNEKRKGKNHVTVREVQQAHIAPTADAARSLLERMEQAGSLSSEEIKPKRGGHYQKIYRTIKNPAPH